MPEDIRLTWVSEVPAGFHARFSAFARTYRYLICPTQHQPALLRLHTCWSRQSLALEEMQKGAQHLLGEHDFSAFRGAGCQSHSAWRHISDLRIWRQGALIIVEITANAFLLHMVRNIVGALCAVGRGDHPPEWIAALLASGQRALGPATAPPGGLYLVGVHYPAEFAVPALVGGPCWIDSALSSAIETPLWSGHP